MSIETSREILNLSTVNIKMPDVDVRLRLQTRRIWEPLNRKLRAQLCRITYMQLFLDTEVGKFEEEYDN